MDHTWHLYFGALAPNCLPLNFFSFLVSFPLHVSGIIFPLDAEPWAAVTSLELQSRPQSFTCLSWGEITAARRQQRLFCSQTSVWHLEHSRHSVDCVMTDLPTCFSRKTDSIYAFAFLFLSSDIFFSMKNSDELFLFLSALVSRPLERWCWMSWWKARVSFLLFVPHKVLKSFLRKKVQNLCLQIFVTRLHKNEYFWAVNSYF